MNINSIIPLQEEPNEIVKLEEHDILLKKLKGELALNNVDDRSTKVLCPLNLYM
jgi:hypothetical protein